MAILKNVTVTTPTTPSKEQLLKRTVSAIENLSTETFNKLVNTQRRGIELLWENSGLTPQEIINALGDDAVKVFQFHGALTELINSLATIDNISVDLKLPTKAFTISDAGVVKVLNTPYVP